ncbi:MAG: hypothetical protein HY908_31135 [Myxococcales bacterium]|nr:hypothetical protein [Myxococcales bacterium]
MAEWQTRRIQKSHDPLDPAQAAGIAGPESPDRNASLRPAPFPDPSAPLPDAFDEPDSVDAGPSDAQPSAAPGASTGVQLGTAPPVDVVDAALAEALRLAAQAGRFDLVGQLAAALEARRRERRASPAGVVELALERERRGS